MSAFPEKVRILLASYSETAKLNSDLTPRNIFYGEYAFIIGDEEGSLCTVTVKEIFPARAQAIAERICEGWNK